MLQKKLGWQKSLGRWGIGPRLAGPAGEPVRWLEKRVATPLDPGRRSRGTAELPNSFTGRTSRPGSMLQPLLLL